MTYRQIFSSAVLLFALTTFAQNTKSSAGTSAPQTQSTQPAATLVSVIDHEISAVEKQVTDAAEAMPEDKFNFSPESLNIPGNEYKGVRSFAVQIKHIAASNYFIWSGITGEPLPANLKGGNGPEDVKTKAEILKFLNESYALAIARQRR